MTVDGFSSPGEHRPDPPNQAHQIGLLNPAPPALPAPLAPRSATVHVRPHRRRRPTGGAQAPAPAAHRRPVPSYVWVRPEPFGGRPVRPPLPSLIRATRGLTLEGFLKRCRIDPHDLHTRIILHENRVIDWPFFLRANKRSLRNMGLILGAARALSQGGISLRRCAVQVPTENIEQETENHMG
ncbi:hypothetical protein PTTG_03053 [Puccinia triticina 1-1 BBBD Race 1]|uniref:SAM domain-containing protein n=1 Tax=Puccinia triticina (isolate 1-1 / race 1 (BBBD)) TaxID=630390 RepID=A0A180GPN0_PUCT1|nr:hypothetical protein PTTG_03053 [Puccinia triticina 1-1 BBBD Race 1]